MFKPIIIILATMALLLAAPVIDPALLSFDPPHHFFNAAAIAMPAIAATGSWSIRDWCAYRGISVTAFYKMRKLGTAPTVTHPKGAPARISAEADAAWLKRVNDLVDQTALEQRRQHATVAAAAAVASERHVSKRSERSG
jgi:hypothetical protein